MESGYNPGRVAGFLYLLLGFAVVRLKYIPGACSPAATPWRRPKTSRPTNCSSVSASSATFITATAAIFVALALYRLFQGVNQSQAVLLVILGGPMPASVYFCNALNDVAALMFARPADFVSAIEKPQRDAFVMLFLRLHDYGLLPMRFSGASGCSRSAC